MDKEMPIGIRFSLLHRSFKRQLDERLKEKELTGVQFGVLGQLGRLERTKQGEIFQKDLEAISHVTHPTMTEILKRLEKQGFISCHPGTKDRIFAKLCTGLSGEQISSLIAMTDVMIENAGCTRKGKQKI